jgi:adenylate cyclase
MDRILQWAWDRHGTRYSWALCAMVATVGLPIFVVWSLLIVAVEQSSRFAAAAAATVIAVPAIAYAAIRPGSGAGRLIEQWAAGHEVDRAGALNASYAWTRGLVVRGVALTAVGVGLLSVVVGAIAQATGWRLAEYGFLGAVVGVAVLLPALHSLAEAAARPARVSLAGDTEIGDSLPRSRPSFAAWSSTSMLAVVFVFAVYGAMLTAVFDRTREQPVLFVAIGCALTVGLGLPLTVGTALSASLRPIRDLAEGTERVAAGEYSQRLPVVQDDDLGALAASFNRMQAGLAERQRLQAAFGTYVDPTLAARLLEQGDDVFTGERRQVTVMFVDVRDFTPFAEANSAEDTVARLNALFEIVVPAVVDAGGHVNKFLGDGALAVFGAPNDLTAHADAAVTAAVLIHRAVAERFDDALRIGIGINTGVVIAGTIGGGGKLEFTLIGDTVNVAARVEQLTKTTADAILLTRQTVDAFTARPPGLTERGSHTLKGKLAEVEVFALDPAVSRLHPLG